MTIRPRRRVLTVQDAQRLRAVLGARIGVRSAAVAFALLRELDRAVIVDARRVPPDVVTMNSRVVFARRDHEAEATLVYPWDADASTGAVSVLSELGSAMIGCRVGTRVTGTTSAGAPIEWSLVQLLYQPEVAGDLHL